jgi:kynurenine formamidase
MKRFIELSHILQDGAGAYPGLPQPIIGPYLDHEGSRSRYDGKAEFYLGQIQTVTNVGTYIDSPFHRFRDGQDLSSIALDRVAGLPGIVLTADPGTMRPLSLSAKKTELAGRAVLVKTGWDRLWGKDEYAKDAPFLGIDFVRLLVDAEARLVGVDFLNVDDTSDPARPVHTRLLKEGTLIVENLTNLSALPPDGFLFSAVPLMVAGGASFPVRAYAELPDR